MIEPAADFADRFADDGYVILRKFLDSEELGVVREALTTDPVLRTNMFSPKDSDGVHTDIAAWNNPGDSSYGLLARSEPLVRMIETALGQEVYHYHSKVTAKAAQTGGAWEWHQDYDYWKMFGCPRPAMASVMFAIDEADRDNGCLQLIRGSHKHGLLPHGTVGTQRGADRSSVEQALQDGEHVYCEMAAGDAVVFHCNTLHCSDANTSDRRRWALVCCYNAADNSPVDPMLHKPYAPLAVVPNGAIRDAGVKFADGETEDFVRPPDDAD